MDIQEKINERTNLGKKLFLYGLFGVIVLLGITFTFSHLLKPLTMLQIRLSIIGIGIVYCLSISVYLHYFINNLQTEEEIPSKRKNDVIIVFNGKQLGPNEQ
ncbi:cobalamin biosynthesis protein CobD/CbiB [Evansella vedderi]|uniref:Cobalamin biosynthesis protein CobD/CbiB n=1 Tax=Evansella vedderi TaxID=38282 RepID=A0ABT9ZUC8_9BACI|nr:hypothetical protein [Evansella vedderi]MDQ0254851.1 cobalamin biosynthesis protein CobD/CbiB [Evansella vedderi]